MLEHKGADIDCSDAEGLTALHHACFSGFEDTVEALLAMHVDIDAHSDRYGTPLCLAALRDRKNVGEILIRSRADVHASSGLLGSPMHCTCYGGTLSFSKMLIDKGCNVDEVAIVCEEVLESPLMLPSKQDTDGYSFFKCTPSYLAARFGSHEVLALLLGSGANVNAVNREWTRPEITNPVSEPDNLESTSSAITALMVATNDEKCDNVRQLIAAGANVNAPDLKGNTPIIRAAFHGNVEILEALADAGASIDWKSNSGVTAVGYAAFNGKVYALRCLADLGADLHAVTGDGNTALHFAATQGQHDVVELLLDLGLNVNQRDNSGWTPLMSATNSDREAVVRTLIDRGADISIKDMDGVSASNLATTEAIMKKMEARAASRS